MHTRSNGKRGNGSRALIRSKPQLNRSALTPRGRSFDSVSHGGYRIKSRDVILGIFGTVLFSSFYGLSRVAPETVHEVGYLFAVAALLHGLLYFVFHGGARITAGGVFMAASAIVVGLAGAMVISDHRFATSQRFYENIVSALFYCVSAQVWIGVLVSDSPHGERLGAVARLRRSNSLIGQAVGVSSLIFIAVLGDRLGLFYEGFAFAAALLICICAILDEKGLSHWGNLLAVGGALAVYALIFFDGLGRLRVIAIFLSVLFVFSLRYGRRFQKVCFVLLLPAVLAILGQARKQFELTSYGAVGDQTGLSSMLAPIRVFAHIISLSEDGVSPALGASFLTPLRSALPEGWVPDWVPRALGYELGDLVAPEAVGTGYSTFASVFGEWFWNFGQLGIVVCVPVLAWLLRRLDWWLVGAYLRSANSMPRLVLFVFWSSVVGGVGDLVWAGFHTWVVRMYARVLMFLVLGVALSLIPLADSGKLRRVGFRGASHA